MTHDNRERINWLWRRIQEEKHQKTFNALVRELDELLQNNERPVNSGLDSNSVEQTQDRKNLSSHLSEAVNAAILSSRM
jgi:hypothetical protein